MSHARPAVNSQPIYRSVEKSQTLLLNEQSRNLEATGREVFKFGFGQSPFPPLAAAVDALKANASAKAYSPVQGIPELRQKIAAFHSKADAIDITADRVLVAPGSKILLYATMAAYEQLDVLIPAPAWVSYAPQAHLLRHTAIAVETQESGRWRVTPSALEKAVRHKTDATVPSLLILTYPGNPDGLSYSADELRALADMCRRYHITVLSDEIYGLLNHKGTHESMARFYPEATIVTGGLSKWCGAGGWRLGMALLPESMNGEFKDVMLGIASETYSCASLPVQLAACEAYNYTDDVHAYLSHQRKLLSFIGNWSAEQLQQAGLLVHSPEGAFYLFVDFTPFAEAFLKQGISTSQALCERLLAETGVALLPGDVFGLPASHLSARLAYVEFDGAQALAASQQKGNHALDETVLKNIFGKTTRGIESMCQWVKAF